MIYTENISALHGVNVTDLSMTTQSSLNQVLVILAAIARTDVFPEPDIPCTTQG